MNAASPEPPGPLATEHASAALQAGELVILPTDTVYGICAASNRQDAVVAIFEAKQRPKDQPLQLLFSVNTVMSQFADLTASARTLIDGLGPGGWTIVLGRASGWTSPALGGGRTVGIRIPDHPVVSAVVDELGAPLAATSANRHGCSSPATCDAAIDQVGRFCTIAIDAGPSAEALDSTVVDCTGSDPSILREGAIDRLTIARILGLRTIPVTRSVRPEGTR